MSSLFALFFLLLLGTFDMVINRPLGGKPRYWIALLIQSANAPIHETDSSKQPDKGKATTPRRFKRVAQRHKASKGKLNSSAHVRWRMKPLLARILLAALLIACSSLCAVTAVKLGQAGSHLMLPSHACSTQSTDMNGAADSSSTSRHASMLLQHELAHLGDSHFASTGSNSSEPAVKFPEIP